MNQLTSNSIDIDYNMNENWNIDRNYIDVSESMTYGRNYKFWNYFASPSHCDRMLGQLLRKYSGNPNNYNF